jgi:hypothetical protein
MDADTADVAWGATGERAMPQSAAAVPDAAHPPRRVRSLDAISHDGARKRSEEN